MNKMKTNSHVIPSQVVFVRVTMVFAQNGHCILHSYRPKCPYMITGAGGCDRRWTTISVSLLLLLLLRVSDGSFVTRCCLLLLLLLLLPCSISDVSFGSGTTTTASTMAIVGSVWRSINQSITRKQKVGYMSIISRPDEHWCAKYRIRKRIP